MTHPSPYEATVAALNTLTGVRNAKHMALMVERRLADEHYVTVPQFEIPLTPTAMVKPCPDQVTLMKAAALISNGGAIPVAATAKAVAQLLRNVAFAMEHAEHLSMINVPIELEDDLALAPDLVQSESPPEQHI